MEKISLFKNVFKTVPAYSKFFGKNKIPKEINWDEIPIMTKENYLTKFPMNELYRRGSLKNCFLIGTSSGFSKGGSLFWPKESVDEKNYIEKVKELLIKDYSIDKRTTLIIVNLALGTWIGGMQLACTFRNLASQMEGVTVSTPGMNLKEGANIVKKFGEFFEIVLWVTNPSSINIISYLMQEEKELLKGKIFFPVVGEYFSENFREDIAKRFGHDPKNPVVVKTGYGSADTGDLGIETVETIMLRKFFLENPEKSVEFFKEESPPMLLAPSSKAFIEIIDGEIVVTKDQFIPLIRYNTKDSGGIIPREKVKDLVDKDLFKKLPENILYVFGRAKNSIIFYGTNLNVNKIGNFFESLDREFYYGGLFEVRKIKIENMNFFEFTIYTTNPGKNLKEKYKEKLLEFLKNFSNEFAAKYDELKSAAGRDLISVKIANINEKEKAKKHKIIIEE